MAAAVRRPAPKKRKVSSSSDDDDLLQSCSSSQQPPAAKKKSPLFNLPQNYYAPPTISSMTKEELSEWRKEQRRKRNRESAAASRNKTRARIDELEGEVELWKRRYEDLEAKMRCMERHVQFLTKFHKSGEATIAASQAPTATVVSHPNSPPSSPKAPVVPNVVPSSYAVAPPPAYHSAHVPAKAPVASVPNLFPPLLSEPRSCRTPVEEREASPAAAASAIAAAKTTKAKPDESKEHVNQISRQA